MNDENEMMEAPMISHWIRNIPLFEDLSTSLLDRIAQALELREYKTGEVLFNQGESGDTLFLVAEGRIALFTPGAQPIRVVSSGDYFGEISLIDRKPRSLSARAEEDARVYCLCADDFRRLMDEQTEIASVIIANLCERVRYTTDFLNEVRVWVEKMSEGDYSDDKQGILDKSYKDRTLATMAEEFTRMAALVQERENRLRLQVDQMRIEIDQVKRKQEAGQIMNSDYFRLLQIRAKDFRESED